MARHEIGRLREDHSNEPNGSPVRSVSMNSPTPVADRRAFPAGPMNTNDTPASAAKILGHPLVHRRRLRADDPPSSARATQYSTRSSRIPSVSGATLGPVEDAGQLRLILTLFVRRVLAARRQRPDSQARKEGRTRRQKTRRRTWRHAGPEKGRHPPRSCRVSPSGEKSRRRNPMAAPRPATAAKSDVRARERKAPQ